MKRAEGRVAAHFSDFAAMFSVYLSKKNTHTLHTQVIARAIAKTCDGSNVEEEMNCGDFGFAI